MRSMLLSRLIAGLVVAAGLALAGAPAVAAPPRPAPLSEADRADLARVTQYLNSIKTMSARFQQYSNNGGTATGVLYLSRPGHMRFEYDAPTPILLVADGMFVIYYDKSLNQTSYLPIGSTPAWFLLRDNITLNDVTVTKFERGPGVIRVSMVVTKEPDNGTVSMTFGDHPLELKQWAVTDPTGKTTTVVLVDPRIGAPVDPNLFVFKEPSKRARNGGG
jgi:outer membrane lipoprotein-sorting protein